MEDFISDIYRNSIIVSNLKEFVFLINSGRISSARSLYNETAQKLENLLIEMAVNNPSDAASIQDIAIKIRDCYEDFSQSKGIVEGQLIPALYKSLSRYNTISVTEGKYTLESSDTGFLTAKDNEIGKYMHDIHDPMYEAYQMIGSLYKPEMEGFMILGCGLGYEAYQVYHRSDGAIMIYIYDEDENILSYARLYGVLSLIPEENLTIIYNSDREQLAEQFISDLNSNPAFGYNIAAFKKNIYDGVCSNELNRIIINSEYSLESVGLRVINLWKNKKLTSLSFSHLLNKYDFKEYIVISAGPSLDDSLEFLKNSKGIRGLIAVNTVLRRLLKEEITPDIVAAADPSPSLTKHIDGIEAATRDITLIADWVLSWKYTSLYRGDICFVKTNASAELTQANHGEEPVWDISGTVACLAIEAAVRLGCKKVYLVGQDLAYPSGRRYAGGMPHGEIPNAKWDMQVPSVDGGMVGTCEAFDWFRKAIEYQIAKYDQVEFINMSTHGALIKGAVSNIYT